MNRTAELLFVIVISIFSFSYAVSDVAATVYYVDASAGNDARSGQTPDLAWQSVSKINASRLLPGDQILFRRGQTWRALLNPPASGTQASPIIFGAYGSGNDPIISGADLVTNWSNHSGNIWKANSSTEPKVVLFDGVYGINKVDVSQLSAPNEWVWSGSVLYIYSLSDPSSGFSKPGIEAGARNNALYISHKNFLVFNALNFHIANIYVAFLDNGVEGLTFDGCNFNYGYEYGLVPKSEPAEINVVIRNCSTKYNGSSGIHAGDGSSNWLIQNNTSFRDSYLYGTGELGYGGGIKVWGTAHDIIIENNTVILAGKKDDGSDVHKPTHGFGIWLDTAGAGITIRYNKAYQCAMNGITVEKTSNAQVYYNLAYNNGSDGISMHGDDKGIVSGNAFYNNVSYANGRNGISAWGPYLGVANSCNSNSFKNNIAAANGQQQFSAKWGCENDQTHGSGNVYIYNAFGVEAKNFIEWGSLVYKSTYGAYEGAYGSLTYSMTMEPLLVDPINADFTIKIASPAVNSGEDVGLTRDFAGSSIRNTQKPNIGAFESTESPLPIPYNLTLIRLEPQ